VSRITDLIAQAPQLGHRAYIEHRALRLDHAVANPLAPQRKHERMHNERLCDIFNQHFWLTA